MVIPRMEGMVGDETMCSLVGDNRATGLIVSRLYIGTKSYLVVAVQNAAVLLPPAYSVRIAGYRLSWANQSGEEMVRKHSPGRSPQSCPSVKSIEPTTQADFVELFNPGNFKAQKGTFTAGQTYDVKMNPALDLTRTTVQEQTRVSIAKEDPMI